METEQRNERIRELRKELNVLEEEQSNEYEEEKKATRVKIPFSDEQLDEVADKLSRSKEVFVYFDTDPKDDEYEDDGFIGVTRKGVRFCKEGSESALAGFARNVEKQMNLLN